MLPSPLRSRTLLPALLLAPALLQAVPVPARRSAEQRGPAVFFLPDPHAGDSARALHVLDARWGRLVDVHEADPSGRASAAPVLTDVVVRADVLSDDADYRLEADPSTSIARLVVLRRRGAPEPRPGAGTFTELLARATAGLPRVATAGRPTSVPRDAALVLSFDAPLEDGPEAERTLGAAVRLSAGSTPLPARVLFDRLHGRLLRGRFHPTRVIVDTTVSRVDAARSTLALAEDESGLPAGAAVRLALATRPDAGGAAAPCAVGGATLAPPAGAAPATELEIAFRAADGTDAGGGVLPDTTAPEIVGSWPVTIDGAVARPGGEAGRDFVLALSFLTSCRRTPAVDDVISSGLGLLRVTAAGAPLGTDGRARDVAVRVLGRPLGASSELLGRAALQAPYDPTSSLPPACWVDVQPAPAGGLGAGIDPASVLTVRFSEPMDAGSLRPFDTLRLVRGAAGVAPSATSLVVGELRLGPAATRATFAPSLPLAHRTGVAETYRLLIAGGPAGITDRAGNPLRAALPPIELSVAPGAADEANAGIVLRFDAPDEFQVGRAAGVPDVRGQFTYDLARGLLRPRPVDRSSVPIDRTQPVPSLMIPFQLGVQTPLSPLGSKLQAAWRYCDAGWLVQDERYDNLDIEEISWSPVGGQVYSDYFPEFEVLLSHGVQLPDEAVSATTLLPDYPRSGLFGPPHPFSDNVLQTPVGPQTVVHPRELGYFVNPASLYESASGRPLVPYPLVQDGATQPTYTWRDTAIQATGGADGAGIPLAIETRPPLQLYGGLQAGAFAPPGAVPSIGLPLLMELRCYPTSTAVGLNRLDVALAVNSSAVPALRAYSTGGASAGGQAVVKNPDDELVPSGGVSPNGPSLPVDNALYYGELAAVVRVSRAHTIWLDTGSRSPDYAALVVEPGPRGPAGDARLALDFRGADGFLGAPNGEPFDATQLDAYGEPPSRGPGATRVLYHHGRRGWTSRLDAVDGARYLQVRISFLNDVRAGVAPTLSSLAVAYRER